MQQILDRAKELNDEIIAHRRFFHQNPETGIEMPIAYDYVSRKLAGLGYVPQRVGKYSVVATAGGKKEGKTFLLRADMDALPIMEETGLPFRSGNGMMHACGHDCHAAMLLGAARILKEMEYDIPGTVRLFFQTGEETLEGAKEAVEAGLLDNPKVDAAMMIHIMSGTSIPDGTISLLAPGSCYASADWYRVDVRGQGGHGAMPHTTVSAINIIAAINTGIQEIMSVVVPRSAFSVMTVGQIHAGGTSNIIPETAFLTGTIRSFDEDVRNKIKESLVKMCEQTATARGGSATVTFSNSAPATLNDKETGAQVLETLRGMLGREKVLDMALFSGGKFGRVSGSEDFAYIAEKVPSAIVWLSAGTPAGGYKYPGHNPKADFKEDVLYVGAASYAAAAISWH